MESSNAEQQQQQQSQQILAQKKGWLSRWTRKQWSRHWFVLKNGSLTYYRGQAAEMCSFLDGVLDLSLIKHIEVQQDEPAPAASTPASHHYHTSYLSYHGGQQSGQHQHHHQQFTFTLKMWNGECHMLGAPSAAERGQWLEAINLCTGYGQDDETATDSASSSDSSPTSNLSARSADIGSGAYPNYSLASFGLLRSQRPRANQGQEISVASKLQELKKLDKDENNENHFSLSYLKSSKSSINQSDGKTLQHVSSQSTCRSDNKKLAPSQAPSEATAPTATSKQPQQQHSSENQALKRRLISVLGQSYQERQPSNDLNQMHRHRLAGDPRSTQDRPAEQQEPPKLVGRHRLHPQADLYARSEPKAASGARSSHELAMNVVTDSSEEGEDDDDEDEDGKDGDNDDEVEVEVEESGDEETSCLQVKQAAASEKSNQPTAQQKKRVTFDLSISSLHQLTASSGSDSGSVCTSSGASDSSGSPLSISPSASSDEDEERVEDKVETNKAERPTNCDDPRSASLSSQVGEASSFEAGEQLISFDDSPSPPDGAPSPGPQHLEQSGGSYRVRLEEEKRRRGELEQKLAEAQANISLLETKLHGSYANCGQLELTCQRLRGELDKCQASHKSDLGRMKLRADELSRELLVKEAKLAEVRDKMVKYEELLVRQQHLQHQQRQQQQQSNNQLQQTRSASKALNCWLKQVSQQTASNAPGNQQHHHALLPISHIKQSLHSAANQQHVSMKLLNHSKQIQRKLNELELKVDKISQSTKFEAHATQPLVN